VARILVADDSSELGAFVRTALERAGYEVVAAASGTAAIAAVERNRVDAAILDVLMPGMSGDVIAERLRRVFPALPVLLMTGSYGDQFTTGVGAPVLHKPFTEEQLVAAVRRLTA
jgi:CheY-like chemotaxis protein